MDLLVGRNSFPRSQTLQSYGEYKVTEVESRSQHGSGQAKLCLDFETLALRVEPPTICVEPGESSTLVTVDSANMPGILVELIQHFTEAGLCVKSAKVSSESSWFIDVFELTEMGGGPVLCPHKIDSIKKMLNVNFGLEEEVVANGDLTDDPHRVETTVFELAGMDSPGLLADVTQLLTTNGCNVRSAAVWTYASRVAFVLSVTAKGQPIQDGIKLQRLRQLLLVMMSADGRGTVNIRKVRGEVHHDRRLHQLMLAEAECHYDLAAGKASYSSSPPAPPSQLAHCSDSAGSVHSDLAAAAAAAANGTSPIGPNPTADDLFRSPKHCRPDVSITYCSRSGYWTVDIRCRDRAKLLFDTVCTLADCGFDVFHATIDSNDGLARQEFYVRPRGGVKTYDEGRAARLRAMLEASVQRRHPKGLKVHVHSVDRFGCLASLTRVLKAANLTVTRAKVKTYAVNNSSGHTFYVMNADGTAPDRATVEEACSAIGGRLVDIGEEASSCSPMEGARSAGKGGLGGQHTFSFSILSRQWQQGWRGSPGGNSSSQGGNSSSLP